MTEADKLVLDVLKPYMSDMGYVLVVSKVGKAGSIANLKDSVAIAELEMAKKKFSSRSEAGRYAAEIRWAQGEAGRKLLPPAVTGGGGGEIQVAMQDGAAVEFQVMPKPASEFEVGDLVSGRHGEPSRITDIVTMGDKNVTFVLESIDGEKRWSRRTQAPTKEMRYWREAGKTSGKLDPTRLIDHSKIEPRDRDYIEGGKTGPERVRRRNEVIDWYAARGVDVVKPARQNRRGGKQWLGQGGQ